MAAAKTATGSRSSTRSNKASSRSRKSSNKRSAARTATQSVLRRHSRDLIGIAAIAAGLLVAGSVWADLVGRVGDGIDTALSYLVGFLRVLVPISLIAIGYVTIRGHRIRTPSRPSRPIQEDDPESPTPLAPAEEEPSDPLARTLIGSIGILIAATGILHVTSGRPGISDDIGDAGGVLGLAIGGTIHAWADVWGSILILFLIGFIALIVLTQLSVTIVAEAFWRYIVKPIGRLIRSGFRSSKETLFGDLRTSTPEPNEPSQEITPADPPTELENPFDPPDEANQIPAQTSGSETAAVATTTKKRKRKAGSKWILPPMEFLAGSPTRVVDQSNVAARGELLHRTLEDFGVPTHLLEPVVGPTVTRFVLELGEGVKVSKLESLRKDIAYAMASPDVRILAPIPGQRAIGVEVPNLDRQVVALGDVLRSNEARAAKHPLEVAVGCDINGRSTMANLAAMPHLLIAGATGAGKSSCINSIITSILMRSTPDEVRMILVDPKRVEMGQYDRIPHLLTAPVTDPRKAANALAWAVREMERRYDRLHATGFRDITGYNAAVAADEIKQPVGRKDEDGEPLRYEHMPFYLVVVDELADLMMVAARDVEDSIARLAQMARAVGIHLVIATQRPSVNIITGVIKANVPTRLAFAVSSLTDSRVILDQPGAERLVGKGDMLLLGASSSMPHRIQGCWVTETEVRKIVEHWVEQAPEFEDNESVAGEVEGDQLTIAGTDEIETAIGVGSGNTSGGAGNGAGTGDSITTAIDDITAPPFDPESDDELLQAAMELIVQTQLGSTSMLQRKLRVGFARAGRLMDLLEEQGVVGPSTGSKAREVLMSPEDLENRRAAS